MRNLTDVEIEIVSGGGGKPGGKEGGDVEVNILTLDALNDNCVKIGDVASKNLSGNSLLNCNKILNDLIDVF